jgi:hypothetical protein
MRMVSASQSHLPGGIHHSRIRWLRQEAGSALKAPDPSDRTSSCLTLRGVPAAGVKTARQGPHQVWFVIMEDSRHPRKPLTSANDQLGRSVAACPRLSPGHLRNRLHLPWSQHRQIG